MKNPLPLLFTLAFIVCCLPGSNVYGQQSLVEGTPLQLVATQEHDLYSVSAENTDIIMSSVVSSTCESGNVSNNNNDPWSEECYLNNSCNLQGNPCQANDVNLLGAYLADIDGNPIATCEFEEPTTVYLWGTFINGTNSSRYAVRTRTEVWINGEFETELNSCSFDVLEPGQSNKALIGEFTFTCGDAVEFRSTWVGWETSASQCSNPSGSNYKHRCGDYGPSKCSKELNPIRLLSPNFSYDCGDFTETTTQVCFSDLTTGGEQPYSYLWNFGNGDTSTEANPCYTFNATTGVFNVTLQVTDADGVMASATLPVDLGNLFCPDPQLSITKEASLEPCAVEGDMVSFTIIVENTGNQAISNITVSDPMLGFTSEAFGLPVDGSETFILNYSLTAADLMAGGLENTATATGTTPAFNEISVSATETVDFYSIPTATANVENVLCFGGATGSISLTMTGGTAPYTFSWSHDNELNAPEATGLVAGDYDVTITDANDCSMDYTFTVNQPGSGVNIAITTEDESCDGANDGSVTIALSGGTAPYSVVITDGDGNPITLDGNNDLQLTSLMAFDEISISNRAVAEKTIKTVVTVSASGLAPGTYYVTVTDNEDCEYTDDFIIEAGDEIEAEISVEGDLEFCEGGSVTLIASGGVSYLWSTEETTASITVTESGTYSVTVTNEIGCEGFASVEVEVFENPTVNIDAENEGVINCNFLSIDLTANGSATGSYEWTGPNGFEHTGAIANVDAPGTYTVVFTDENGCEAEAMIEIEKDVAEPTVQILGTETLTCTVEEITLTADASDDVVSYLWSNGSTESFIVVTEPGDYDVTVTAANGCTDFYEVTIGQNITEPTVVISGAETLTCSVEEITLTADASDDVVSYLWSNGSTESFIVVTEPGDYDVTVTAANGCTDFYEVTIGQNITEPTVVISGAETLTCSVEEITLTADASDDVVSYLWSNGSTESFIVVTEPGDYDVTVTAANGCTDFYEVTIGQNITEPTVVISGAETLTCSVEEITLTADASDDVVSYLWSNGSTESFIVVTEPGDYDVTVTAANGCTDFYEVTIGQNITEPTVVISGAETLTCSVEEITLTADASDDVVSYLWSNGSTESFIVVTEPGDYDVTVTAANGCTDFYEVTIGQNITEPTVVISGAETLTCSVEEITLTADASDDVVSYLWSNGSTESFIVVTEPGDYDVTVTAANGCTDFYEVTIGQNITEPTVVISGAETLTCSVEEITLTADASDDVVSYLWSNGSTESFIVVTEPGDYDVTVTAANGCTDFYEVTIGQNITEPAVVISGAETLTCSLEEITLTADASDDVVSYLWSNGSTESFIVVTEPGDYDVTVTAANGCTDFYEVTIGQNITEPTVVISGAETLTCSVEEITLTADASDDVVSYLWSNGSTESFIVVTEPGDYEVTVTAANGCTDSYEVTIEQDITDPTLALDVSGILTCDVNSVTLSAETDAVSIEWHLGEVLVSTDFSFDVTTEGVYTAIVTGANGCTMEDEIEVIKDESVPSLSLVVNDILTCLVNEVTLTATTDAVEIQWSLNGEVVGNDFEITVSEPGVYTALVTGENGCTASANITVLEDVAEPELTLSVDAILTCDVLEVTITADTEGDVEWFFNEMSAGTGLTLTVSQPGIYTAISTGLNGCFTEKTIEVEEDVTAPVVIHQPVEPVCLDEQPILLSGGMPEGGVYSGNGVYMEEGNYFFMAAEAGDHTIIYTATGDNGCEGSTEVIITVLPLPTLTLTGGTITCEETEVTLTAETNGETVTWFFNGTEIGTGLEITVEEAGTYTAVAESAEGCTFETTVEVLLDLTPFEVSLADFPGICETAAPLALYGGSPEGGAYSGPGVSNGMFDPALAGLGFHEITYTYGEGECQANATASIEVLQAPCFEVSFTDVSCYGAEDGSITVTINSECGTVVEICLEYEDENLSKCDPFNKHLGGAVFNGLVPGTYYVVVTGANGCVTVETVTIGEPPLLVASATGFETPICSEEETTVTISATGGTPPYTGIGEFTVGVGTHIFEVTDANGCVAEVSVTIETHPELMVECPADIYIGEFAHTIVLSGATPEGGIYAGPGVSYDADADEYLFDAETAGVGVHTITYTVEDEFGCIYTCEFIIEVYEMPDFTCLPDMMVCQDAEPMPLDIPGFPGTFSINGEDFINLQPAEYEPGTYEVLFTYVDEFGFVYTCTFELIVNALPEVTLEAFDPVCTTTEAFALSGGLPEGGTYSGDGVVDGMFDPSMLTAGVYEITYTYTDDNGCTASATQDIEILQAPCAEITFTDVTCYGAEDGTITVNIDSDCGTVVEICLEYGDPDLDKCSPFNKHLGGATFTGLIPGTYYVVIVGENGCVFVEEVIIGEPAELVASFELEEETICIDGETTVTISATGGTPPYTGIGEFPVGVGTHIFEVLDANDCLATITVVVNAFPELVVECPADFAVCEDAEAFALSGATPEGGTYYYNGEMITSFDPAAAGVGEHVIEYHVADDHGCEASCSFTITVNPLPQVSCPETITVVAAAEPFVLTGATPEGGVYSGTGVSYDEELGYIFNPAVAGVGSHTIAYTYQDENGCTASCEFSIEVTQLFVDLGIEKLVNNATPDEGEVVTFTITVTNHNTEYAATGVTVIDLLPDVFEYQSHSGGDYDPETGIWTIGTIPAGGSVTLTIDVIVHDSGDNTACIFEADQLDDNSANNCATVGVAVTESSGGDDGGIESDGNMASKIALRHHRRMVEGNFIEKVERRNEMSMFNMVEMHTGNIGPVVGEGAESTGIGYYIPETGPANTQAFISTPADLLGITNANEIFAVDYLQTDNSRRAAILAIATDPQSVYEHTKVICDRLTGASLDEIRHIEIAGHKFILSKLVHPNGYIDYAVTFIATRTANGFTIDNRWYNEEYQLNGNNDVFNFQVWSVTPQFTKELVESILDEMSYAGELNFRNAASVPGIPQVYVQTGRYRNGKLLLNLVNKVGADEITLYGSKAIVENGNREWFSMKVSIPTTHTSEVEVPVGYIFDAGFSITNNVHSAKDVLYYADGPWFFDYDPGNAVVTDFRTSPETGIIHERSYNVERDATLRGSVSTWASLFRRLGPGTLPMDLTEYDQVAFKASGIGKVEVMLAKAGITAWNEQYRKVITLNPVEREYFIDFRDLVTREGERGFTAEDVITVIFNPIGNGTMASTFEVNISNLHFTSSLFTANSNGIFYPTYPNPFRDQTTMEFAITNDNQVRIEVLNMYGQVVDVLKDEYMTQGFYKVTWTPRNQMSGMYLLRITVGNETFVGKTIYQR
jgi:uncharacterized repeat protein (TIGR01451 family)